MDRAAALITDLWSVLSDLDVDGFDPSVRAPAGLEVATSVVELEASLRRSVASLVALRLVLMTDGAPVTLVVTSPDARAAPLMSLRLSLGWLPPWHHDSTLVVVASEP